jgi:hypothetical protein
MRVRHDDPAGHRDRGAITALKVDRRFGIKTVRKVRCLDGWHDGALTVAVSSAHGCRTARGNGGGRGDGTADGGRRRTHDPLN